MNAAGHIAVVARAQRSLDQTSRRRPHPARTRPPSSARQREQLGGSAPEPGDTAARLLGAALPDLAAMGRFRLRGQRAVDSAISDGISLHHRTDELFHGHPWFLRLQREIGEQLESDGVGRGPARACSHVGIELLLDGELLAAADTVGATSSALRQIDERREEVAALVRPEWRAAWERHLDRLSTDRLPTWYHKPEAVADVLYRMLSRRRRLAFKPELIPTVSSVLARAKRLVDDQAEGLVDELAATLIS